MNSQTHQKVDPVTTEVIRHGLLAVTSEMKTNLMRTAYNIVIYEALDFTVGIFTPQGETVSIGIGLPMFVRGMAQTVKAKIKHFGLDGIEPGDILITNDAYTTGSHLNHVTLTLPIFSGNRLVAFACCMAHWLDIGGTIDRVTTEIYQEGLQIPILKYARGGQVNQDILDIIALNVRMPATAMGDLRAQVAALRSGEKRFLELVQRYKAEVVEAAIAQIMNQSERDARLNTLSIPDGIYEAESFMDDDGVEIGVRIPIRVKVEVRHDEMTIDLSEVGSQVRGFYNSGPASGIACAQVAYKCLTSPTDYPVNDGCFRPLKVIIPSGKVVSAERPASMSWWMTVPMTVIDTIFRALAEAIPERSIAGHYADLAAGIVHGLHPIERRFYIASMGLPGGGWGAKSREDGISATICINDGDTHNTPIEQLESRYPVVTERLALRTDSGGAGRHRGGLGAELCFEPLASVTLNTVMERMHCKPWGLQDGLPGAGNEVNLRVDGAWITDLPNGKLSGRRIKQGDAFVIRAGGGGGFGPPSERDPAAVAHDVREGYVSLQAAREIYQVVFDPLNGEVDFPETETLRARIALSKNV